MPATCSESRRLDERLLHLGLDLFQRLGGDLLVQRDEESLAFGWGQLLEDVGDVGRVHLREAVLLDLEADAAGGVAVDQIDEVPWNDARAEPGGDSIDRGSGQPFQEAADCSAHAHFHFRNAQQQVRTVLLSSSPTPGLRH